MRAGTAGVAVLVAAALGAAGCGSNSSCPTAAAYAKSGTSPSCSGGPQQVSITLSMCEACSHTSPTCTPDLQAVAQDSIFLDTRWEVCADNSSCAAQSCAQATCSFAVPAGTYTVQAPSASGTSPFTLTVGATSASCSGTI